LLSAGSEHRSGVETKPAAGDDLAARVHEIQVVVREMIYPGDDIRPRPELAEADVETLTRVRSLLVDASTKLERRPEVQPDPETAMSLLREASDLLDTVDPSHVRGEAAAERDAALRGIQEITSRPT
jgi:hypothetical protein